MLKERIGSLLEILSAGLHEKEEAIRLSLLSSIAGESLFLLGPPGVAKSLLARKLKHAYKDATSFEYLMGRFSTPDEIFGPISIKNLKNEDKYERLVENYLPDADIVFLDEIWKASPAIQNSLLTALNEKLFRNGQQEIKLKIKGIIAASNELPTEEGLEAIWDRFIIRLLITGIKHQEAFNEMIIESNDLYEDMVPEELKITDEEYRRWHEEIDSIELPQEVLHVINVIRNKIMAKNIEGEEGGHGDIYISDRRWKKIVRLLRTSAFLNDRQAVDVMDCFLIICCIWNKESESEVMNEIVVDTVRGDAYQGGLDLQLLKTELQELQKEIEEDTKETVDVLRNIPKKYNNGLYKITGFVGEDNSKDDNMQAFIEKNKFEGLKKSSKKSAIYFGCYGSAMKYKKVYTVRKNAEDELVINNETYSIETEWKTKKEINCRKPSKANKDRWDHKIVKYNQFCKRRLLKIAEYKKRDMEHAVANLFVNSKFSDILFANLDSTSEQIDSLKLEIDKIKDSYESIN